MQVFAKIGGGGKGGGGEGEGRGVIETCLFAERGGEQEEKPSSRSCFTLRVFSATMSASKMLENYYKKFFDPSCRHILYGGCKVQPALEGRRGETRRRLRAEPCLRCGPGRREEKENMMRGVERTEG